MNGQCCYAVFISKIMNVFASLKKNKNLTGNEDAEIKYQNYLSYISAL